MTEPKGFLEVLLVADDPDRRDRTDAILTMAGCVSTQLDRLDAAPARLRDAAAVVDIVLLDLTDQRTAGRFQALYGRGAARRPLVALVETEEAGATALRLGADDYLLRREAEPPLMAHVLRHAIRRWPVVDEDRRLASYPQENPNPVVTARPNGQVDFANPAARTMAQSAGLESVAALLPPEHAEAVASCLKTGALREDVVSQVGDRVLSWSYHPSEAGDEVRLYSHDISGRVAMERALREERDFAASILNTKGALVIVLDTQGRIVHFNPACQRMTGWSAEEVKGRNCIEVLVPADQKAMVTALFDRMVRGEVMTSGVNEWVTRSGERREIAFSNSLVHDPDGEIRYVVGTGIDETEGRETRRALETSERRLRLLAEHVTDMISQHDREGHYLYVSSACRTLLGYEPEELVGRLSYEVIHPEDRDYVRRAHFQVLEEGGGHPWVVRLLHKDGSIVWGEVLANVIRDAEGHVTEVVAVTRDAAQRLATERALVDAREQLERRVAERTRELKMVTDSIPGFIAFCDAKGRYRLVNRTYSEWFGRPPEEIIGRRIEELVAPDERDQFGWQREEVLAGKPVSFDIALRDAAGDIHYMQGGYEPKIDTNGRLTGYYVLFQDMTERKTAEMKLREAKEGAELADRAKTEFLANMSHELRTPLNAIIGFSDIMIGELMGPLGAASYRDYVRDIHESGRHLLEVINEILDMSKVESGQVELAPEPTNLDAMVDVTLRMVSERAQSAQVSLTINLAADLPPVLADQRRLKQILLNLLSNAIKFTPPGGTVDVSADLDPAGCLRLVVADTGVGMTPVELQKALTPFGQVDSALARRHEGTGLGLPLTQAFVEMHDGAMRVESEKGTGTKVSVILPPERVLTEVSRFGLVLGNGDA